MSLSRGNKLAGTVFGEREWRSLCRARVAVCALCASKSTVGTMLDGTPRIEGEYPLASWKELSSLDPENRFEMKHALAMMDSFLKEQRSDDIFSRIVLMTPFFLSMIPVLLCLLVGRGQYEILWRLHMVCTPLRSNS